MENRILCHLDFSTSLFNSLMCNQVLLIPNLSATFGQVTTGLLYLEWVANLQYSQSSLNASRICDFKKTDI